MAATPEILLSEEPVSVGATDTTDGGSREKLPEYALEGQLVPMMPLRNKRYTRVILVAPEYKKIPRGLHTTMLLPEPQYLPPGWKSYINPEGSPFYVNEETHTITDDPIQRPEVHDKIRNWERLIVLMVKTEGLELPEEYNCYITIDENADKCSYYFVDHLNQTVFWLEEIDPERHDVDMWPVYSLDHMKWLLQEQYWIHCEFFPHRPVPKKLWQELLDTFRHGRVDQLTSDTSTFPYNASQCKEILDTLDVEMELNPYMNWSIARFWATISRHKYDIFFGEDCARVSRDQQRLDKGPTKRTFMTRLFSTLLFNLPLLSAEALNMVFIDNLSYQIHWQEFIGNMDRGWNESLYISGGLLMIATTSIAKPTNAVSECLGAMSVVCSIGGAVSSGALLHCYHEAKKYTSGYVANHLSKIQCPKLGFEPIAQVYSVPRALVFWSIIFLVMHMLSAVVDFTGLIIQAPAILLAAILFGSFLAIHNFLQDTFPPKTTATPMQANPTPSTN